MGWWARLRGQADEPQRALYERIVALARDPDWYRAGAVPDTVDGRFDMIAAVLATVLLRFEDAPDGAEPAARLAERFVDDMDGQLREIGVGDIVVGKHIGRMMAMLGGRLGAYRDGWAAGALGPALVRNLYRGVDPGATPLAHVEAGLAALRARLAGVALPALAAGELA